MRTSRGSFVTERVGEGFWSRTLPRASTPLCSRTFYRPQPGNHRTKSIAEQADSSLGVLWARRRIGGLIQKGLNMRRVERSRRRCNQRWKAVFLIDPTKFRSVVYLTLSRTFGTNVSVSKQIVHESQTWNDGGRLTEHAESTPSTLCN